MRSTNASDLTIGRDVIQVVKRLLATCPPEQEQMRATAERTPRAALGQPVQVELVPHAHTAPQQEER